MELERETGVVGILARRAREQPDARAFTFLRDDVEVTATLTFRELHERAQGMAARFRRVASPGECALLLYPPGPDYVIAFFGCLYAGIISVPLYAPQQRFVPVIEAIAQDCAATAVFTTTMGAKKRSLFGARSAVGKLPWLESDVPDDVDPLPETEFTPDNIAYLQYTSGSTATPKGVIIDHGNIVHQCAELAFSWQVDDKSRMMTWLPHFHDFGQIGAVLLPVFVGCESVRMAPATFVRQPIRWLEAVSRYRATHTAAPNFAFELCVNGTTAAERAGLDLSSLIMACNGAEPVRLGTLRRFTEMFAGHGLGPDVLCPGYGLAEATLKVTGKQPREPLVWGHFDPAGLGRLVAEPTPEDVGQPLVACGWTVGDTRVAIVDPDTGQRLPDGRVGEIRVAGPIVARGYWGRPDATEETFGAQVEGEKYLRTGDLGFRHDGQLYVCGRIKDVVIVNGVNHYPQDIERTAEESHPAIRRGRTAAFSVEADGRESVVVVVECGRHDETPPDEIARAIRDAVSRTHELTATVAIAETGAISLTSSGKIQRSRCRADFLEGRLRLRHRADAAGSAPAARAPFSSAAELLRHGVRAHISNWIIRKVDGVQNADEERSLSAHGVGSLHMMELHQDLENWTGISVPEEWIWESTSIDHLAGLVADRLTSAEPGVTAGGDR